MKLTDLSYHDPVFPQPEALKLVSARFATIDNWTRFGHIAPSRDEAGRKVYSFEDLLVIEAADMLAFMFKMPPTVAVRMGKQAAREYEPYFARQAASVERNGLETDRHDTPFIYVREGDTVRELKPNEEHPNSVMLVLPTGSLARGILKRIRALDEQDAG